MVARARALRSCMAHGSRSCCDGSQRCTQFTTMHSGQQRRAKCTAACNELVHCWIHKAPRACYSSCLCSIVKAVENQLFVIICKIGRACRGREGGSKVEWCRSCKKVKWIMLWNHESRPLASVGNHMITVPCPAITRNHDARPSRLKVLSLHQTPFLSSTQSRGHLSL